MTTTETNDTTATIAGEAEDSAGIVDAYLAAYCEPDTDRRADLIRQAWEPDGELVDPPLRGQGDVELAALTDAVLSHFPGHVFRRTSAVDEHHGRARYTWDLVAPDGSVTLAGTDFVEFADSGKLARVTGYFGPLAGRDG